MAFTVFFCDRGTGLEQTGDRGEVVEVVGTRHDGGDGVEFSEVAEATLVE